VSDPAHERRGYRVVGRVQGVGFRWSASRVARGLGLRGSIRNAADGSVEVSAEGSKENLERFARWLAEGPRGAAVEKVETTEPHLPIPENGFEIIR
jgi:acylphosphatase